MCKAAISEKYLLVAVKHKSEDAFVLTAFYTDRIKRGKSVWEVGIIWFGEG